MLNKAIKSTKVSEGYYDYVLYRALHHLGTMDTQPVRADVDKATQSNEKGNNAVLERYITIFVPHD